LKRNRRVAVSSFLRAPGPPLWRSRVIQLREIRAYSPAERRWISGFESLKKFKKSKKKLVRPSRLPLKGNPEATSALILSFKKNSKK
jgi:hypothetical protein